MSWPVGVRRTRSVMPSSIAWGEANLYQLPDGTHLWGREFQVLPSGSMFGAAAVLDGLIGCDATPLDNDQCEIRNGAILVVYGIRQTETDELAPYQLELAEAFNELQGAQQA